MGLLPVDRMFVSHKGRMFVYTMIVLSLAPVAADYSRPGGISSVPLPHNRPIFLQTIKIFIFVLFYFFFYENTFNLLSVQPLLPRSTTQIPYRQPTVRQGFRL